MVSAFSFRKAQKNIDEAIRTAKSEMKNGEFTLIGIDNDFVHFKISAKLSDITLSEICDIKAKTRFHLISEKTDFIYCGEFKTRIC